MLWNEVWRAFVRTWQTLIILFITKRNLIIDLFWKIGYRHWKGHVDMCRDLWRMPRLHCIIHNNRIEATFYYLHVSVGETWELHKLTGSVVECYFFTPNLMLDILFSSSPSAWIQTGYRHENYLERLRRDAAIIHRMQNKTLHFKIAHARNACLCFPFLYWGVSSEVLAKTDLLKRDDVTSAIFLI